MLSPLTPFFSLLLYFVRRLRERPFCQRNRFSSLFGYFSFFVRLRQHTINPTHAFTNADLSSLWHQFQYLVLFCSSCIRLSRSRCSLLLLSFNELKCAAVFDDPSVRDISSTICSTTENGCVEMRST